MMKIKAVLFDLDNTLMNRKLTLERFTRQFLDRYFPEADVAECVRMQEIIRIADNDGYIDKQKFISELSGILPWKTAPDQAELLDYWYAAFPECAMPMEGLFHVLDQLKADGRSLGLITNGSVHVQYRKIDRLQIRHYFNTIIVSEEVNILKPDIRIFQTALERLKVEPYEALYIGDHPMNDIHGSRNAGLGSVWLQGFMDWIPSINEADCTINRLTDLLSILRE